MWKNVVKIFIGILILVNSIILGTVGSQIETLATDMEFPTDMPLVYVNPQNISFSPGETFTVNITVFNLTDNYIRTQDTWEPGEPLPSPDTRHGYFLGNLYALDIKFSWDPTLLEYVSHTVKIPVEDEDGVLNEPVLEAKEELDADAGTYLVAYSTLYPAEPFNCPDANATVFTMTFNVTKEGACALQLEEVELAIDPNLMTEFGDKLYIPHQRKDALFRSAGARTRILNVDVGALVGEKLHEPVIIGENASVRVVVINDGAVEDEYNLTLTLDDAVVSFAAWTNESLAPGENKTYGLLDVGVLDRGLHLITGNATIKHDEALLVDEFSKQFRVIDTPVLNVSEPLDVVYEGDTVTFDASQSSHKDPDGAILNYSWLLYEPGGPDIFTSYEGVNMSQKFAKNGTWRIILDVRDSWGVEYDQNRAATAPYQKEILLDVEVKPQPILTVDQIALIVIVVVAIVLVAIYLRRRRR